MPGGGRNRASPCVSTSTSRSIRSLCSIANRAARAPPGPLPDQHGRDRTGLPDELVKPRQDGLGIGRTVGHLGRPETGQVRCDDPVGRQELRDHPHPHGRELPLQEDDRWAVTAFQHGGGHPGHLHASLGDGQAGQESLTRVVTGGPSSTFLHFLLRAHGRLSGGLRCNAFDRDATEWPAAALRAKHPNRVATRRG